jgi:hypothetical protein
MSRRVVTFHELPQGVQIEHFSLALWNSPAMWNEYLRGVEEILSDRLVRLDDHDPIRRKSDTAGSEGDFVVDFGKNEHSRWVWGRFEKTKVEITIWFHDSPKDPWGRCVSNMLSLEVPKKVISGQNVEPLVELFNLGNKLLKPYYAIGDLARMLHLVAFSTSASYLEHERELNGVYWLTYFSSLYADFFGRDRLRDLFCAAEGPRNGVTFRLAASPAESSKQLAIELQEALGANAFASRRGPGPPKEIGEHVLTYPQLLEEVGLACDSELNQDGQERESADSDYGL